MLKAQRPMPCGAIARNALGDDLLLALGDVSLTPAIKAVLGLGATEQPPVPRMKVSMRPIFISGLHGCPGRHSTA